MNTHELSDAVRRIRWRHTIDLGQGIVTPGSDPTAQRLHYLSLPESLQEKSVLDIGANDGFYSFEAERRGAKRVMALDTRDGAVHKDGFELARRALNSQVEDVEMDVLNVAPETVGIFDIVLFLGVLYHLRHPLLALERIHHITKELLIVESHIDLSWRRQPIMTFYPGAELNNDSTNWWGPNPAALRAMIRSAGFRQVRTVSCWPSLSRRFLAAFRAGLRRPSAFWNTLNWQRIVLHARP